MKRSRAIQIGAILLASVMLLSSCTPIGKMQQNGWIKKLSKAFPDDTFTFDGHPEMTIGGIDYSVVKVESENYPGAYVSLWKEKGKLYTNYLALVYEEDIYEELYRVLDGRFPCSSYSIGRANQDSFKGYPVEDIGPRRFIKEYMDYRCRIILFYEDESQIPDDDEIKQIFLDLLDDENHIYDLQLYYCDAQDAELAEDNCLKYYKVRFQLFMTEEDHINNIYVDYCDGNDNDHFIVRDMDI